MLYSLFEIDRVECLRCAKIAMQDVAPAANDIQLSGPIIGIPTRCPIKPIAKTLIQAIEALMRSLRTMIGSKSAIDAAPMNAIINTKQVGLRGNE